MIDRINRLKNRIEKCNKCKRLRNVTPIPYSHICFAKSLKNIVLCIGRNPGLEHDYSDVENDAFFELYHERWLKSKAGKYILLNTSEEFVFEYMFWTNICKCSSPDNSKLTTEEVNTCSIFLKRQISILKPKLIFTFGSEAFSWFFPSLKLSDRFCMKNKYMDCFVVPFYHYAYFARTNNVRLYNLQKRKLKTITRKFK